MSATKSKRVRVLPVHRAARIEKSWLESRHYLNRYKQPKAHVITGYTGPANRLKRLVEIAAMDYDTAFVHVSNDGYSYSEARVICAFLRLSHQLQRGKPNDHVNR